MATNSTVGVLRRSRVRKAKRKTDWHLSNQVLYDLCIQYPGHADKQAVIAKILLIGRVYSAAIERRKSKVKGMSNNDLYLTDAAPKIVGNHFRIDGWINKARGQNPRGSTALRVTIDAHKDLTAQFHGISKQDNRSLASKYLHFHVPRLFFIFDARAVKGMREVSHIVGRASRTKGVGDNEYRKFVEKCLRLRDHCWSTFYIRLTPRELDNLLLDLAANGL